MMKFIPTDAILDPEFLNDDRHFTISWRGTCGFGIFSFRVDDDHLLCENECMGKKFVRKTVELFIQELSKAPLLDTLESDPTFNWPSLLKKYGSVDAFMDACHPMQGEWK